MDIEKPFENHPEFDEGIARRELVDVLLGGTPAIHKAGERYLPRYAAEGAEEYRDRLKLTRLWSGYAKALAFHADRVFEEPIKTRAGAVLPEQWPEWVRNIDGKGSSLNKWAHSYFYAGEHHGIAHALADGTTAETVASEGRGFLSLVTANQLRNWKREFGELVEIRIAERGDNGEERRRIITPTEWVVYERVNGGVERKVDEGPWGLGVITLSSWIAQSAILDDADEFVTSPFLQSTAEVNLEHYQSNSTQRNALEMVRRPIFVQLGDIDAPGAMGGSILIESEAEPGKASFESVDQSIGPVEVGFKDLELLREEVATMTGQSLLNDAPGSRTATEKSLRSAEASCGVQRLANECGEGVNNALFHMGLWAGVDIVDATEINQEVGIKVKDHIELVWRLATEFGTAPKRMQRLLIDEYMRGGKIGRSTDVEGLLEEADNLREQEDSGDEVADIIADARDRVASEGNAENALAALRASE